MIQRTAEEIRRFLVELFGAIGAGTEGAECLAEHLVTSTLRGVDSHGIERAPTYAAAARAGELLPGARPFTIRETPTSALVSGGWGFGVVAGRYAMNRAIDKALDSGVAVVSLVEMHHLGRLGDYVERAAAHGLIASVWAGGFGIEAPQAAPLGGKRPYFAANPLAIGFPAADEAPVIVDFGTTDLIPSKIREAQRRGDLLPPGSAIDASGRPSTDPSIFDLDHFSQSKGALLPFGGHKGYGIMVALEIMGRILAGADHFADRATAGEVISIYRHQGATMIVLRADLFQPLHVFTEAVDTLADELHDVPTAPGIDRVLLPGEREAETTRQREREGITLSEELCERFSDLADSLGISDPFSPR